MEDHKSTRPPVDGSRGIWPSVTANSFREQYLQPAGASEAQNSISTSTLSSSERGTPAPTRKSSEQTAVGTLAALPDSVKTPHEPTTDGREYSSASKEILASKEAGSAPESDAEDSDQTGGFMPIRNATSKEQRLGAHDHGMTEDLLIQTLSRRMTKESRGEEQAEVERLISRMFGKNRQAQSEDEKTRHVGVIFKNLTVRGVGLGAALQPTVADPFLALPRLIGGLFSSRRQARTKPPTRSLISNFSGCIR